MSIAVSAPRIWACAETILGEVDFPNNPYLRALVDGAMSLDAFQRSQEQFYFAVSYFPRPMAALMSRLPDPDTRTGLLENLVEEHGHFRSEAAHPTTFRGFLRSIGARGDDVETIRACPAVEAFNVAIHGACLAGALETGLCCLGVIEHAFAGIAATIGRSVIERGWVPEAELVHYQLHAEIDARHAEEFYCVAEPGWDDPQRRNSIERGLALGAYLFDRLYRDLQEGGSAKPEASATVGNRHR